MWYVIHLILTVTFVAATMPITALAWLRLDSLWDEHRASRGRRRHAAVVRLLGSTLGWWIAYTALLAVVLGEYLLAVVPAAAAVALIGSSLVARSRRAHPWWYNRVPI
jgi:hypothetical protein